MECPIGAVTEVAASDRGLVDEVGTFARQFVQRAMRDGDTFAAATAAPPEATPLERIVAFSGRTVTTSIN